MKNNLKGEYKEAYKQIQKQINQERLHPRAFKDANNNLIQYLEVFQNEKKELEDYEVIKKEILKNVLYRSRRTHILLWIAIPLIFIFVFSLSNLSMNYFFSPNEVVISLTDFVLAFYLSFALIEGISDKYTLLFVFSGIPVAILSVIAERYFQINLSQVNLYVVMIVCLIISLISYYFIHKEYKDWKKS